MTFWEVILMGSFTRYELECENDACSYEGPFETVGSLVSGGIKCPQCETEPEDY